MQLARFVRTLGLLLVLGLAGFGGGCGPGTPTAADQQKAEEIGKDHRGRHEELKAAAKKAQAEGSKFEGKGARHRGR
jgi:hypothetical protein